MRGSALVMNAANDDVTDITAVDEDKDDCVIETQEELNERKFKPLYAYFVLFITLIARIMVQWQRKGINYSYGYTGLGLKMNNPLYEMGTFYPQLTEWYGWLIGFFYTIPYCFFGLVAGKMTDTVNRKTFLGIVLILAGAAVGVSGVYDSFLLLAIMRMVHGCLNSASNPVSFSLIQDYFPPEKRATANSLIQAGNYIGVGVSSLSILLINQFGWRYLYKFMGGLGVIFGIFTMLFVKEPERGGFLDEATKRKEARKKAEADADKAANGGIGGFFKSMNDVFKLPTCRNVLIAGSLRNFGGIIISSFLPLFFGRNYAAYKS
jgi:MFS family permease